MTSCPDTRAWERGRHEGADEALHAHLAQCARCRTRWHEEQDLAAQARALPVRALSARAHERVRRALLVRAAAPRSERLARHVSIAAALLLVCALGAGLWREQARTAENRQRSPRNAHVLSVPQPTRAPESCSGGPDCMRGHPSPAIDTSEPHVARASVPEPAPSVVRPRSKVLVARAREQLPPAPAMPETTELTQTPALPDNDSVDAEESFREGFRALRMGRPALAALWLARVPEDAAIAEDASYWQGVALARAHRLDEAAAVLSHFIDRYPEAPRRDEAAVVLGWVFIQQRKEQLAVGYFAQGLLSDDPVTRERAARGMARARAGD